MNPWYLGTTPAAVRRISLQLSVPPPGTSNSGKTESLKASESPTTATLTIHTAMGIKKNQAAHTYSREAPKDIPCLEISLFISCLLHSSKRCYSSTASLLKWNILFVLFHLPEGRRKGQATKHLRGPKTF